MDDTELRNLAGMYTGYPGYLAKAGPDGSWTARICQMGPDDWRWLGPVVATAGNREELGEQVAKLEAELAAAGLIELAAG